MSRIAIVGKNFAELKSEILRQGHEYIVLKDILLRKDPSKKYEHVEYIDFSSRENTIASITALQLSFDAAICVYENYVLPTAWICDEFHLPGMPIAAAEACTDKYVMRRSFMAAKEKISPDFAVASDIEAVKTFAASHTFPLILKPANLMKSLLVTKNNTLTELLDNYQKTAHLLATTYARYAPSRTPKMIVEEFMQGTIHSVDALVDDTGTPHLIDAIVDYQTGYDIGYDDNFHYSRLLPSTLPPEDQKALLHCADIGIRSLNMKNSAAHVEIIMTAGGPRIVEIGARNGGYRERMHRLANGVNLYEQAINVALGKQPDYTVKKREACAVLELFPKQKGKFSGLHGQSALHELPSLQYISIKPKPGDTVGKSSDGYKMCAVIMLHHENTEIFEHDLAFVNQQVFVETI